MRPRRFVKKLLTWSGYDTQPLGTGAWLVRQRSARPRRPLVTELDRQTWLVQQRGKGRRSVVRIGPPELRTHLVIDEQAARTRMDLVQHRLGQYLAEEQIAWVLRDLDINCVLDVGANVGQYGKRLRRAGYEGRIVSFEPVPPMVEELRALAADDPDWLVMDFALGEEEDKREINVAGTLTSLLDSSQFGRDWARRLRGKTTETIRIRRLDNVFEDAIAGIDCPRTYLKMDTQGFDLQAFRGAGHRVDDLLALQSEVACLQIYDGMPRYLESLATYEDAGFELAGFFPVSRHSSSLRAVEFDAVMVRGDAKSR